jgi:hypothetical protein
MSFLTPFTFYLNFTVRLHLRCYSFDKTHLFKDELSDSYQGFGIIIQYMDTPNACDEKRKGLVSVETDNILKKYPSEDVYKSLNRIITKFHNSDWE